MKQTVLNVWIVDDEAAMCQGVLRVLQDLNVVFDDLDESIRYNGAAMESGEAFLDRLDREEAPQLLLLDGKLPGVDGIEVLKALGTRKQSMVTVMITAYATLENAVKATKLGAFDFLAKPFTPPELRHTITRATREIILMRRARQLEQEKRRVRFEFLSVLAHELKSPLAALDGFVEMLRIKQSPEALDRMQARILGMRKLIHDLLDLTALESGQRRRDFNREDLLDVARAVVSAHADSAKAMNVAVSVTGDQDSWIEGDRGEMEMLLGNLVSNAIKYNVDGGHVTVNISTNPDKGMLVVADTGIGIAAADLDKLFGEFSRIKNSRTRLIDGSGLGLSIVKKIADMYGAVVSLKSEDGQGTTFTVAIPKVRQN